MCARHLLVACLLGVVFLAMLSCSDNPSEPSRENVLDQENPETEGDPFGLTAEVGASAVTLRWQRLDIPSLVEYRIYRRVGESGDYSTIATIDIALDSCVDSDIDVGTTYYYKVAAVDAAGASSEISHQVAASVHSLAAFSINNGDVETSSREVTLTIRAASCDSIWTWNGTRGDSASGQWLRKDAAVASIGWNLAPGPGLKTVHASLRYSDGHREHHRGSIEPAAIAPSMLIEGGADLATSRNVELIIDATGAIEMMLANSQDFSGTTWQEYSATASWTLSEGDGDKTVYLRARNDFLVEAETSSTIRPAPIAASMDIAGGADSTTTRSVVLALNAVGATDMMLSNSADFANATWQAYSPTVAWELEAGGGIKTVRARIRNDFSMLDEVMDTISPAPLNPSLVIAGGAESTSTRAVELSLTAVGATEVMISNTPDHAGSIWRDYATTAAWELVAGPGAKTVYAKYRNDFGIEADTSDSILPAPTNATVHIDGDVDYTATPAVELTLTATGGVEMLVSNLPDFSDAAWQAYVTSLPWSLATGDGSKTVYVRVRNDFDIDDDAGDTIVLDETPPDVSGAVPTPAGGQAEVANPVTLMWPGMTDLLSGIAAYRVVLGTGDPPSEVHEVGSEENFSAGELAYDTQYFWQVVAIDAAGNESTGPIWSFHTTHWADWIVPEQIATITDAAAAAAPDDVILVSPGVYYESDIALPAGVMVVGSPGSPESVVINAGDGGRHFSGSGIEIEGLMLINGIEHSGSGGSVTGSGQIGYCLFEGNRASQNGGAVSGNFFITNSEFRQNHATGNGGAVADGSAVSNCYFSGNTTDDHWGSAISNVECTSSFFDHHDGNVVYNCGSVIGCSFTNINAYWSGIVRSHGVSTTISNCVFYGNNTPGGMILLLTGTRIDGCTFVGEPVGVAIDRQDLSGVVEITNCVFSQVGEPYRIIGQGGDVTALVDCSNIWNSGSPIGGRGNFSADPMFCDPENGDFSIHADSPCQSENSGGCGLVGALSTGCGASVPKLR